MEISLIYLEDRPHYKTEKLYEIWVPTEPGIRKTNREFCDYHDIPVHDARSHLADFDVETTGFKFVHWPTKFKITSEDLNGPDEYPTALIPYMEEGIQYLKDTFKAEKVICWDWRYRKNTGPQSFDIDTTHPERAYVENSFRIVHTDESPSGGFNTLSRHLTKDEFQRYTSPGWRSRIITCWRPMVAVVEDTPLALCDRRTVAVDEPVPCDKVMNDYIDESYYLKYNPAHKWYYLSKQTEDEVVIFAIWDSKKDDKQLVGPPHAAFDNPKALPGAPKRESLETRFIVITSEE